MCLRRSLCGGRCCGGRRGLGFPAGVRTQVVGRAGGRGPRAPGRRGSMCLLSGFLGTKGGC